MKAILEFNLPEEQCEFKDAQEGGFYKAVLQEFDNYLRGKLKYEELSSNDQALLETVRQKLHDCADNKIWD
jgi:hypothetical protein